MKTYFGARGLACIVGSNAIATVTARSPLEVASPRIASAAFATSRTSSAPSVSQRSMQSVCSSDAVTISLAESSGSGSPSSNSSSYAAYAGCYQDTGLITSQLPYYTPSGLDLPYTYIGALDIDAAGSDSTSTFARWILGDHETAVWVCASNEPAESVHPGEATWSCSEDAGTDDVAPVSAECGGTCENSDPGETTCTSETLFVTSSAFPSFEGCYEPTGEEAIGQPVYSKTGELVEGEPLILMSNLTVVTGTEVSVADEGLIWNLGLFEGSTVPILSCISGPSTKIVHASDALWSCDVDGDSVIGYFPSETADTPGLFEVSCGGAATTCADASSSSATDGTTADRGGVPSSDSETSPTSDDEAPTTDNGDEDNESTNDGATTSTGGGVRLAASPASPVSGVVVGLAMATLVGGFDALCAAY